MLTFPITYFSEEKINPFKLKIQIDNANDTFILPTKSNGIYDFTLKDGQGNVEHITTWNDANNTITYASAGDYTIEIYGTFKGVDMYATGSANYLKLIDIPQWGIVNFGADGTNAFRYCSNIISLSATDSPDLSALTNGSYMFNGWTSCTTPMDTSTWDLSSLTNGVSMFNGWTSCTTPMDTSTWDLSSLTNGSSMFNGWTSCTTPMDTSTWDLSSLTNGVSIFNGWTSCTTPMDFSNFDLSNVTTMQWFIAYTTGGTSIDFSDSLKGTIINKNIINFAFASDCPSIKLQAGAVTSTSTIAFSDTSLTTLILIGMSISFNINGATALSGTAIDDLANSVADMTSSASPSITMTTSQHASCNTALWAAKNWTIVI